MVWRACERFHLLPPGVRSEWASNTPWSQALILAYGQVREIEESENQIAAMKAMFPVK